MRKSLSRTWLPGIKGWIFIITAAALVTLALVLLLNPAFSVPAKARTLVEQALEHQSKVDRMIDHEYKNGKYSLESPLLIQDPYGFAPLTALLIFDTSEKAQISVHIPGKTDQAAVNFTLPGYNLHNEIPIFGLYPGTSNQVTIQAVFQDGQTQSAEFTLQTEPAPVYLEKMDVLFSNPSQYSPGFNFSALEHKPVYDLAGDIRWYTTKKTYQVVTRLKNGHFLFTYLAETNNDTVLMEQDLLGKIYAVYYFTGGIQHEVTELPWGNFLVTTQDPRAGSTEDILVEIDRSSGHIVHYFDLKDLLDPYRPNHGDGLENDWLHMNSITYLPDEKAIMISSREQSAVVKFSYPEMKIKWILGAHDNWSAEFQPYLLEPTGEVFDWSWMQHHATEYRTNEKNPAIVDVLLFDNGVYRSFDKTKAYSPIESYSRVVHYRIDEVKMTVEQVWEYGKARGSELFSVTRGSAYQLTNGNILGTWSDINRNASGEAANGQVEGGTVETRFIEINPADSKVIFESSQLGVMNYRMFRAGLYDSFSIQDKYFTVNAKNTSASDLIDRVNMLMVDIQTWKNNFILQLKRFGRRLITRPEVQEQVEAMVSRQTEVDKNLRAAFEAGQFSLEAPLIVQNPYGTAPLTALVMFDTPEPAEISIKVPGKTSAAEVSFNFPGYQTHHEIPIYGLYAGETNRVLLRAVSKAGNVQQTEVEITTEPLPVDMKPMEVLTLQRDQYSPGFTFVFLNKKAFYDIDGAVRWYSTNISFHVVTQLKNGHYMFTDRMKNKIDMLVTEQDLLGRIYAIYYAKTDIHHEICVLPNGNLLMTTYDLNATTIEDIITEVDRKTGRIVREFDLKNYLDQYRGFPNDGTLEKRKDWLHLNSIFYNPTNQTILLTSRSQSAVFQFTYPQMELQWIFSAPDGWAEKYQPALLHPVGEPFEWISWLHHGTVLPGSQHGDVFDLLVYDNGVYRIIAPGKVLKPSDTYSRIVIYRIDQKQKTVQQIWEYGTKRGSEIFSGSRGSSYLLENGNLLGTWGDINKDRNGNPVIRWTSMELVEARVIEVNPVTNQVVFEGRLRNEVLYRAMRVGFYDHFTPGDTRYIDAGLNNTTRNNLRLQARWLIGDLLRWVVTMFKSPVP